MTKLAPEWVRTSDPVIRSSARYRWTMAPAPEITDIGRSSQWDFPRRRALFTSDGTYSGSSESDTSEGHVDRPPEGQNGTD